FPTPALVSDAGRFDFDYVGIHIAQEHSAIRPRQRLRQIDYSNVLENACHSHLQDKPKHDDARGWACQKTKASAAKRQPRLVGCDVLATRLRKGSVATPGLHEI